MNVLRTYLDTKLNGTERGKLTVIVLMLILAYNGLSYRYYPHILSLFFSGLCFLMFIMYCAHFRHIKRASFSSIVIVLAFLPYLSIINTASIFNQPIIETMLKLVNWTFVWMLYFMLHIYKVKESTILQSFQWLGITIVVIQIIQQFTYPNALFGVFKEENLSGELASMRNGIYRFRVDNNMFYTLPFMLVLLSWLQKKFEIKLFVLFSLLLVSVYFTLTRQVIVAILFIIFFQLLQGKNKLIFVLISIFLLLIAYFYFEELFGNLTEETSKDVNKDYIRLLAANYYWNDSLKSVTTFLFGYGVPTEEGAFHSYMSKLDSMYFYFIDVGFVGKIWHFGSIYTVFTYYSLFYIIFKYKNITPIYIRNFIIYAIMISIMIFPFESKQMIIVFPLLFYICDLHINNSPLALKTTKIS